MGIFHDFEKMPFFTLALLLLDVVLDLSGYFDGCRSLAGCGWGCRSLHFWRNAVRGSEADEGRKMSMPMHKHEMDEIQSSMD